MLNSSTPRTPLTRAQRDAAFKRAIPAHTVIALPTDIAPLLDAPPCYENGRCVGHERYPGAGTLGLRYCDD